MTEKLTGRVAIVTGASKGIGSSIALHLAKAGASIVVNYATDKEGAETVVDQINRSGGKAIALQALVNQEKDIKRLFSETLKMFGKLDILVNNAGIYPFFSIEELTPEKFHQTFDINVLGLLLASREAVKCFGSSGGNIINIGSVVSREANINFSVYCATKAAVNSITRCLSAELGPRKIRVNAVNPGMVDTEGTRSEGIMNSDLRKQTEARTPLRRIGKPEDIAPAVVFLASDEASWITGEAFFISGGDL